MEEEYIKQINELHNHLTDKVCSDDFLALDSDKKILTVKPDIINLFDMINIVLKPKASRYKYEDELKAMVFSWRQFLALYNNNVSIPKNISSTSLNSIDRYKLGNSHNLRRKMIQGRVISKSGDKSVTIEVIRTVQNKKYGKIQRLSKKYMIHDENNSCEIGDNVFAVQSRPFSKRKRHVLIGKIY